LLLNSCLQLPSSFKYCFQNLPIGTVTLAVSCELLVGAVNGIAGGTDMGAVLRPDLRGNIDPLAMNATALLNPLLEDEESSMERK
jgi:hypothetical protein